MFSDKNEHDLHTIERSWDQVEQYDGGVCSDGLGLSTPRGEQYHLG